MLDIAIILLVALVFLCFNIRHSMRTFVVGVLFSGLILQILNNFLVGWSLYQLQISLVCGLFVSAWLTLKRDLLDLGRRPVQISIRKTIGVTISFASLVVVAQKSQTLSLVSYLSGEDNAKWANLLHETFSGTISTNSVNGAGGLGTAFLILGHSFSRLGLTPGQVSPIPHGVLSSVFMTHLLVLISFLALLILSANKYASKNLAHRLTLTIVVFFIILNTSTFGFLTFNCALLAILAAVDYLYRKDKEPSNFDFIILLLCLGTVSFTWLPLAVLLIPLEFFIFFEMFLRYKKKRANFVFLALGLALLFLAWKYLFSARINYFVTRGSGGDLVWRELLTSGGGTPLVTMSMVLVLSALVVANTGWNLDNHWRHRHFVSMSALLIFPVCCVVVVAQFLDGNSNYAINKIMLFTLVLISIFSLAALNTDFEFGRSSSNAMACFAMLVFIFGGDFQSTTERIVGATTTSALGAVDRPWISATIDDLHAKRVLSVGCINVDMAGMLTIPNGPNYQCSRALIGLAGGEERLIGLHAYTSSRYTSKEMAESLKFYLGDNRSESVFVLDAASYEVIERVALQVLITAIETGIPVVKR